MSKITDDERLELSRIFNVEMKLPDKPEQLAEKICSSGGHAIGNWLRNQGLPYAELIFDVATSLKIENIVSPKNITSYGLSISEMDSRAYNNVVNSEIAKSWQIPLNAYIQHHEQEILKKFLMDTYQRMTPEQKREVDRKVQEIAKELPGANIGGLTTSAALMTLASVGGFAPYILLSTVISTVTAGLAGFGVYTAASSMLHLLLGPVGWTALGVSAIYKFGGPNQQQCLKAVLAISMLRSKLGQASVASLR
ncbi:hypothetical protein [Undibacterium sp. GrIS 1.2]|uniref:hypothetical protein n=1 Tax=Undibacterium sp. GrIS 1.2 TaxID=3143933 RepID=UPI0033927BAB